MLLNSCTTVDRVEKLSEEGAEYPRLLVNATAVAAFGRVRAEGRRIAARPVLLATAPVVERRANISRFCIRADMIVRDRKSSSSSSYRVTKVMFDLPSGSLRARLLSHERRGIGAQK